MLKFYSFKQMKFYESIIDPHLQVLILIATNDVTLFLQISSSYCQVELKNRSPRLCSLIVSEKISLDVIFLAIHVFQVGMSQTWRIRWIDVETWQYCDGRAPNQILNITHDCVYTQTRHPSCGYSFETQFFMLTTGLSSSFKKFAEFYFPIS